MRPLPPSIVIHGHFYQPPREDPWTGRVSREENATPYHDWNERIEAECYGPITRLPGRDDTPLNALEWMSFDVGSTLLRWLESHAPATYGAILEADRRSASRLAGHGNAIAMPYHHLILPLASRRDKVTEVRWGIADFRRRFGRDPEGMWLPETAVDEETLEVLAAEGILFTVLAPHQAEGAPASGAPGRFETGGGRSIAIFLYDGPLSHGAAFGQLLRDPEEWVRRLLDAQEPGSRPEERAGSEERPGSPERLVSLATDGETYGHHHEGGLAALAFVIEALRHGSEALHHASGARVENFASFLARHPARGDLRLLEPSSWSCAHGVERWRSDCGCKMAPEKESQQAWRAPLREGLEWLATELHRLFEREAEPLLGDPWAVRDAYGEILGRPAATEERWLAERFGAADPVRARLLLEMERDALRMFTSCGWFFDDLGGLETAQVLRYAAHSIDRVAELGGTEEGRRLEAGLLEFLARAPSNDPQIGDAARFYRGPTVAPGRRLSGKRLSG